MMEDIFVALYKIDSGMSESNFFKKMLSMKILKKTNKAAEILKYTLLAYEVVM